MQFQTTFDSPMTFDEAVAAIEANAPEHGFRVLYTHDVAATLNEKGFPRDPLKIIEVCNAKFASQVLAQDVSIALFLPCPITVYTEGGQTRVSALLPSSMTAFFPDADIAETAAAVEKAILEIIAVAR